MQVWDRAEQYRLTGSPMGWLLAVCRNLCLTRLRREERHAALSEEEWDAIPARECGLDADERALLQGALASLTDEERRIVLLHACLLYTSPRRSDPSARRPAACARP